MREATGSKRRFPRKKLHSSWQVVCLSFCFLGFCSFVHFGLCSFWLLFLLGVSWLLVFWVCNKPQADARPETKTPAEAFERQPDLYGWLLFYAERSIGSWHPRRNVRFSQRLFRHFWAPRTECIARARWKPTTGVLRFRLFSACGFVLRHEW